MQILSQRDLQPFHTFSIPTQAQLIIRAESVKDIIEIYQNPSYQHLPKMVLGSGSDTLFCNDFPGVVILNRIKGKIVREDNDYFYLDIAGGEDWPQLVQWSIEEGIYGLENLALIPGRAASAPIQNIGAYGVELKDVCDYVEILDLHTNKEIRLSSAECEFAYRESIFKHSHRDDYIITAIGLKLAKTWKPQLSYGPLKDFDPHSVTAQQIFERVCAVRMQKLPDPSVIGNAGSFFKNPVVSQEQADDLLQAYPDMPSYATVQGVKLAAGWLIDQCSLKGHRIGGAQVHPNQALVLTNLGAATAQDILQLATLVCARVEERFGVTLEHEVRFMCDGKEVTLAQFKETL